MPNWRDLMDRIGSEVERGNSRDDLYDRSFPGAHHDQKKLLHSEAGKLRREAERRGGRAAGLQGAGDAALLDPRGSAGLFQDLYAQYIQSAVAPMQRQFGDRLSGVSANVASRFGGNASSEERGAVNQVSDIFSRNLSEAVSGTAPAAIGAGMDYARTLANRGSQAQSEQDRILAMILQAVSGMQDEKGGGFGDLLAQGAGAAASLLI